MAFQRRWRGLRPRSPRGRIRIYDELSAQVRKVRKAGLQPSHLDTHKHTHLLPPVLDAVARIASEFQIPWVRRPFDLPAATVHAGTVPWHRRVLSNGLGFARARFHRVLTRHGCRTTDHFAGFQITGHYDAAGTRAADSPTARGCY